MKLNKNKYSRRKFLNRTIQGSTGLIGLALARKAFPGPLRMSKSRVVVVTDERVLSESYTIHMDVLKVMLDVGIKRLTGIHPVGDAWH